MLSQQWESGNAYSIAVMSANGCALASAKAKAPAYQKTI